MNPLSHFYHRAKTQLISALVWLGFLTIQAIADPSWPTTTEFLLEKALFNPVLTVPLIEKAPVIDGTVNEDEWANASLIPDLIADAGENAVGGGLVFEERARYWIQYDKDAIYVAARFDVPEWSAAPQVYGTAHDVGGREDAIDIFFDPDGDWTRDEEWHFGGNSAGNTYDRDLKNLARLWRWNPKWDYKARVFPGGWEAEMRIPFAEFEGRKTPVPGEKWRCNLYSVRQVPNFGVSSWAYVPTWRTPNMGVHGGWLIFSGEPLAARFDQGANVAGSHGILVRVVGTKPAEPIQTKFQLYRREGMPKPDEPGQMVTLCTLADNIKVGGTDSYGLTHEKAIELGMSPMKKVEGGVEQTANAQGLPSIKIRPTELGEYMLEYRVTKGSTILTAGLLPFRVKPAVDLQVKPRILLQSKVEFETSLTGMEDPSKAKQLKLTVAPGGIAQSAKVEGPRVILNVPADKLPPGKYTARVDVLDANGVQIGSSTKEFPVAQLPDWWTKKRGFEPVVPKPWTPVKWKKGTVEVWGRTYKFDGLPVPSAITATPDNLSDAEAPAKPIQLLAAPMQLNAKADGQPVTWKCERFEVVQQKPEAVIIESVNTGGGLVLKAKTTIEFDGMIRVDLEVTKGGEPVALTELDLVIPFRPEAAEFLSNYRKAPGPGKIPTRYIGRVPTEHWTFPIFHTQWIGNNKVGLEWFCDSMKGWRLTNKKADEGTEVVRADGRVLETFHMVDKEVKLDQPVAITFGLLATPTKPAPRGWEIYRTDELVSFPPTIGKMLDARSGEAKATQEDVEAWKRRAAFGGAKLNTAFWPNWSGVWYFSYPVDHDPEVHKDIKWKFEIAHKLGMRVGPYSIWAMSTKIPEWDLWGAELIKMPYEGSLFQTVYGCYNSPYTDFVVGTFVKNAKLVGLDGVRHDTIAPQPACESDVHGCGWTDENGKKWPSLNLFATREFFKRMYRETHGGAVKDGFVCYPVAGPPINAFDAFVDIHHIGEGTFEKAHTLKEGYSPEDVRIRMVGTQYGYVSQNNLKGTPITPVERVAALIVHGAEPRLMGAGLPSSYFRGYQTGNWGNPNTREIWAAWKWIDRGRTSLWRPYWENADTSTLTPPKMANGNQPEIYGSYYYIPGDKVLLIVTNYEKEPLADVGARLDLKKLGFGAKDKLFAEDAVTAEPIELSDGALKLNIFSQRFRMVRISKEAPRYNTDRLGTNLLTAGTFEAWPEGFQVVAPLIEQGEPYASKDTKVFRSSGSSLRLTKIKTDLKAGQVFSAPCAVEKGRYLLSGYIRLDADLKPPLEGTTPRHDYNHVTILVNGTGIISDPPREFSMWGGSYPIGEATPGWQKFLIPFDANGDTKTVRIELVQFGTGTAWLDDVQIQKVVEDSVRASM